MANTAALVRESIWRDKDFRQLPRVVQCTYLQLCSQKDLDCAGLLTLNTAFLAKGCDELSAEDIESDLLILESKRFAFVDTDTDELFIRAYMRTAEVVKSPNIFKSALKSARMVTSEKLRVEVAAELRRLRRVEADKLADLLDPAGTPRPDPTKGSGTVRNSERVSKPSSTGTGTVTGSGICSVVGNFGERRPECPAHENNSDTGCRPCMIRRHWDEAHAAAVQADELDAKRRMREMAANCPLCHGTNVVDVGDDTVRKCDHQQAAHA